MENKFIPSDIETNMYRNWESKGYFKCKKDVNKKPFTIVMPPPNVTGRLHMGHALDQTIQDVFIRYNRLKGNPTLWIPGTDHASIATEVKVVERLKKQGITKDMLGREKFLEEAWKWKNEYGNEIKDQIRELGSSCDWEKERFTMDEVCTEAVQEVFVRLYDKGYIYKGERIVNWCPKCRTSISETEVEYEENKSKLWHIKYKVEDLDKYLIVATTRPETMLGDTALAVNPKDERYKDLVGKNAILPILNKSIPIIADDYVDIEFGTGVVKITPAHDPNDFLVGERHDLDRINILNDDGTLNENAREYKGQDRFEARDNIINKLQNEGYMAKIEDYTHSVGSCYRCHTIVEPYLSLQWFVKMDELVKPALEAVRNGDIKFIPKRFEKTYFNWMENIQDWCISRQLWWGHRIPAYYCENCQEIHVSKNEVKKCGCGGLLKQDEDTLDTWFSSALWPFSTLGWPNLTEDFKYFYPTSTLVTGHDIITFWVSKMIFTALEFTNEAPFKHVYIHGIVRDSIGRKMSKSLGNGIDPIEIIEKYGADALRFSLIQNTSPGNDIRYIPEKLDASRNFVNKLWNAAKFANMYIVKGITLDINESELMPEDKWIITKLNKLIKSVTKNIDKFEIGTALNSIYNFIWSDFCDWYIEMVKPRLYNKENLSYDVGVKTLNYILTESVKLLHPYMPFVTEEIFMNLNHDEESIMVAKYPEAKFNFTVETKITEDIMEYIRQIRNLRAKQNIPNSKSVDAVIKLKDAKIKDIFIKSEGYIKKLAYIKNIEYIEDIEGYENHSAFHLDNFESFLDFSEIIDKDEEINKINKEIKEALSELKRAEGMLSNKNFVSKAPENLINKEKEKISKYKEILEKLNERLDSLI